MASSEIEKIRQYSERIRDNDSNNTYYANRIREQLVPLDDYVSSLEDMVNSLSQRVIALREKK